MSAYLSTYSVCVSMLFLQVNPKITAIPWGLISSFLLFFLSDWLKTPAGQPSSLKNAGLHYRVSPAEFVNE